MARNFLALWFVGCLLVSAVAIVPVVSAVPVKTLWGALIGNYDAGEQSISECVYSSGNMFIDALSFRTGRDYSRQFFEPTKFRLECSGS